MARSASRPSLVDSPKPPQREGIIGVCGDCPRLRVSDGSQTLCWRKPDSNHQSRVTRARFQTASFPRCGFLFARNSRGET